MTLVAKALPTQERSGRISQEFSGRDPILLHFLGIYHITEVVDERKKRLGTAGNAPKVVVERGVAKGFDWLVSSAWPSSSGPGRLSGRNLDVLRR